MVYPEESFAIVGAVYDVYNRLGHGHAERTYQKAVGEELKKRGFKFQEQVYSPVVYQEKVVGKNYFDFLISGKIVVELKKGDNFSKTHIEQVYRYLVSKD
ncbi:MAG: GxxExxY protein [Candidatus Doudnabacteria bacterium CG10_big_fil_rev_8_21_14_0_10_41_10]|uniref:GxxExxY protein n=1 Tax=Candidatus Doudnabacteria bacterium CG10_big_fil_rev_8_21_14_0_10_41_10 TaxID=1974551 RepID=A0A2H0VEZ1_9BACT|nr:MAG: GxxExxY protein [Candidatus Doudnabacteria bacterium CG10_big_fil_rev_8_21_14_0_10_41_10]